MVGIVDRTRKLFIVHQRHRGGGNRRWIAGVGQLLGRAAPCDRGRGLADGEGLCDCPACVRASDSDRCRIFPGVDVARIGNRIIGVLRQRFVIHGNGDTGFMFVAFVNQPLRIGQRDRQRGPADAVAVFVKGVGGCDFLAAIRASAFVAAAVNLRPSHILMMAQFSGERKFQFRHVFKTGSRNGSSIFLALPCGWRGKR